MAEGRVMDMTSQHLQPGLGDKVTGALWLVLTPSVDDEAWFVAIANAAAKARLTLVDARKTDVSQVSHNPGTLILTDDAALALAAQAVEIVAIIPEPESSPDAVTATYQIPAPNNMWHASTLLAKAAALADRHTIIIAMDLARRPPLLKLFGSLEIVPPVSVAEVSKEAAVSTAFTVYRNPGIGADSQPVVWSELLFTYDDRAARNCPECGVMDITGRPRMLVWGPNLALPTGLWRAVIRFGVDDEAARHRYRIDWGTQTACISEYVMPGQAGIYEIQLDWQFEEADGAEIRLILAEGCFMGTVIFQGMTVQRIQGALIPAGQAAA